MASQEQLSPVTRYTGAIRTPVRITVLKDSDPQIADLHKPVTFTIVDNLAVPLIIGTVCQDKHIESIQ